MADIHTTQVLPTLLRKLAMKKILSTALISGCIAVFAVPVMAAPGPNGQDPRQMPQQQMAPQQQQRPMQAPPAGHAMQNGKGFEQSGKAMQGNKAMPPLPQAQGNKQQRPMQVQPHLDWKNGQVLNRSYRGNAYRVTDYRQHPGLQAPGKNQRWMQVNGDYILINTLSNVIVSILTGR